MTFVLTNINIKEAKQKQVTGFLLANEIDQSSNDALYLTSRIIFSLVVFVVIFFCVGVSFFLSFFLVC